MNGSLIPLSHQVLFGVQCLVGPNAVPPEFLVFCLIFHHQQAKLEPRHCLTVKHRYVTSNEALSVFPLGFKASGGFGRW